MNSGLLNSGGSRRLRLLHYSVHYAPAWVWGGPPRSVSSLCEGLAALGHEVVVFTTNAGLEHDASLTLRTPVLRNGVTVHYFPAENGALGINSREMEQAAAGRMREFDLTHLSSIWQPTNRVAARAARHARVPYVVSPRGMLAPYSFAQKRWKKWPWYWLRDRPLLKRAAAIHCTSGMERREVDRLNLSPPRWVVPNSIPTTHWRRNETAGRAWRSRIGADDSDLVLLYAGRLHHKKGLGLLPSLLARIRADRKVRLVLVGADEDGTGGRLRQSFAQERIVPLVRFLDQQGTEDVVAAYSGADVFLFPSLSENFGNVAVEALACGCGVVMSPEVGAAFDLQHLSSVRVVPRRIDDWVAAVNEVAAVAMTSELRQKTAAEIAARFSPEAVARAMARHYGDLLAGVVGP